MLKSQNGVTSRASDEANKMQKNCAWDKQSKQFEMLNVKCHHFSLFSSDTHWYMARWLENCGLIKRVSKLSKQSDIKGFLSEQILGAKVVDIRCLQNWLESSLTASEKLSACVVWTMTFPRNYDSLKENFAEPLPRNPSRTILKLLRGGVKKMG